MKLTTIAKNQTEIETSDARVFFSYDTPVAAYIHGRGYVRTVNNYSVTTTKHINKWLTNYGHYDRPECETVDQCVINNLINL